MKKQNNIQQEVLGRTDHILSFDTTGVLQKTTHPTILLLLLAFTAAQMLPSNPAIA
jgi:hypothetical protein